MDKNTHAKLLLGYFGVQVLAVSVVTGLSKDRFPVQQEVIDNYWRKDCYYSAVNDAESRRGPSKEVSISLFGTPSGDSIMPVYI